VFNTTATVHQPTKLGGALSALWLGLLSDCRHRQHGARGWQNQLQQQQCTCLWCLICPAPGLAQPSWQESLQHLDAMNVCMLCTAATQVTRHTACQGLGADDAPLRALNQRLFAYPSCRSLGQVGTAWKACADWVLCTPAAVLSSFCSCLFNTPLAALHTGLPQHMLHACCSTLDSSCYRAAILASSQWWPLCSG